eukprot:GHVT01024622.1.p1 GENE.GHVT01024622.1~~GHVT01024622.1.p1  ORF type:complete len:131 (+),score=20.80 GHVT01024622.1:469-861(+)
MLDRRELSTDTTPDPPCSFRVEAPAKLGEACRVFMQPYTPRGSPSPPFAIEVDPEAVEKAFKKKESDFFANLHPVPDEEASTWEQVWKDLSVSKIFFINISTYPYGPFPSLIFFILLATSVCFAPCAFRS